MVDTKTTTAMDDDLEAINYCHGWHDGDTLDMEQYDIKYRRDIIRGFFERNGTIDTGGLISPTVVIKSGNITLLSQIKKHIKLPCVINTNGIVYTAINAVDFLDKIYGHLFDCRTNIYNKYRLLKSQRFNMCGNYRITKMDERAIIPSKPRDSDNGFDLTIIEKIKTVGDVEFFTTGVAVAPPAGFWSMVVPRSSISKTGYMMANSVGIIDTEYRGAIIIALRKVDKNMPDITLPCRIAQLIPQKAHYPSFVEVDSLDTTSRGANGFGSSGN